MFCSLVANSDPIFGRIQHKPPDSLLGVYDEHKCGGGAAALHSKYMTKTTQLKYKLNWKPYLWYGRFIVSRRLINWVFISYCNESTQTWQFLLYNNEVTPGGGIKLQPIASNYELALKVLQCKLFRDKKRRRTERNAAIWTTIIHSK